MLRVGINGVGRIGRAIIRSNIENRNFDVVAINDLNPEVDNIAYTLNYDTLYDQIDDKFKVQGDRIANTTENYRVYHHNHIDEVPWADENIDIVIDATGVLDNVLRAKDAIAKQNLKKVVITHSPDQVDFTMVLGANEEKLDLDKQDVIAASICDATALAPVIKLIQENFGIESGMVTTLHPWLNYQNVMDGPASSWSVPGEIYHHYALGRSVIGNMIPKPTSAIDATCKVIELDKSKIGVFSYRTPTAIVASSDLSLNLKCDVTKEDVIEVFNKYAQNQKWNVVLNNIDPLVSLDFKKSNYSAIVDHRWTDVINGNMLKIVLWYDNEWGYATRVVEQIGYISEKLPMTVSKEAK